MTYAETLRMLAIVAFSAGYHAGHDDSVDSCFAWCKEGTQERAAEWVEEYFNSEVTQ